MGSNNILILIVILLTVLVFFNINTMRDINRDTPVVKPVRYVKQKYHAVERPIHQYFGIPTRGRATFFKQVGVLASSNNVVLPLYGKQKYIGSNMWLYYTTSNNGHMHINLPIVNDSKDCMDDFGCDELYSGDIVHVPAYPENEFTVHIHKYLTKPRYDPFFY